MYQNRLQHFPFGGSICSTSSSCSCMELPLFNRARSSTQLNICWFSSGRISNSPLPMSGGTPWWSWVCGVEHCHPHGCREVPDQFATGYRISFRHLCALSFLSTMTSSVLPVREIPPHTLTLPPLKDVTWSWFFWVITHVKLCFSSMQEPYKLYLVVIKGRYNWLYKYNMLKINTLLFLSQGTTHPFTDLLNLNSTPPAGASLLIDVFSDNPAPPSMDVSEENLHRWDHIRNFVVIIREIEVTFLSLQRSLC